MHGSPFRKCEIRRHNERTTSTLQLSTGGGRQTLMHRPHRSDRSSEDFVRRLDDTRARRRQDRESGQAMVEFALILFPLLILVGGDHPVRDRAELLARHEPHREPGRALGRRQRLAELPANACGHVHRPRTRGAQQQACDVYLESEALTQGLADSVNVTVCYPDDGDTLDGALGVVGTPSQGSARRTVHFPRDHEARHDRPECERDHAHRERPAHRSPPLATCPCS